MKSTIRHFLKETDFSLEEVASIFEKSYDLKKHRLSPSSPKPLDAESWGLLFFKNSTRTRLSFQVGVHELGAQGIYLDKGSMQLSRGETIEDTAKVVSRYLHGMVIRAYEHSLVEDFAKHGSIPIVNGLTDLLHPCQIYTDAYTIAEAFCESGQLPTLQSLKGKKLVFMGDCDSNMANSWILGGTYFGMEVVLCGPEKYAPQETIPTLVKKGNHSGSFRFTTNIDDACDGADVVYTDVWVSMGDEAEAKQRLQDLAAYQVSTDVMAKAKKSAILMHCLPAHTGEEVSQESFKEHEAIILEQAENRLHVQKAILAMLKELNA
jgi:ornithine carbamoyltransferase